MSGLEEMMEWMVTWKNDVVGWREGVGKMSEASYIIVLFC